MKNVISLNRTSLEIATPDDLIKISEFAHKNGCSVSYIYKLRDKGKLKLYHRGYFKVSEREAKRAMEYKDGRD